MRKHSFVLAAVVLGGVLLVASLAVAGGGKKNLKAGDLNGYEENPDVSTVATGSFEVSIDDEARELTVRAQLFRARRDGTAGAHPLRQGRRQRRHHALALPDRHELSAGWARRARRARSRERSNSRSERLTSSDPRWRVARDRRRRTFDEIVAALRAGTRVRERPLATFGGRRDSRADQRQAGTATDGASRRGAWLRSGPSLLASLDPRDHREAERGRPRAVDDPMVERDRDRPGSPNDDRIVSHHRPRRHAPDAQDRHLGVVDDRRVEQPGELARRS